MSWNYAKMSQEAKLVGGPEKYANKLIKFGFQNGLNEGIKQGKIKMIPWVVVIAAGSGFLSYFGPKVVKKFKPIEEDVITEREAEFSKRQIIDGINKYDKQCKEKEGK